MPGNTPDPTLGTIAVQLEAMDKTVTIGLKEAKTFQKETTATLTAILVEQSSSSALLEGHCDEDDLRFEQADQKDARVWRFLYWIVGGVALALVAVAGQVFAK